MVAIVAEATTGAVVVDHLEADPGANMTAIMVQDTEGPMHTMTVLVKETTLEKDSVTMGGTAVATGMPGLQNQFLEAMEHFLIVGLAVKSGTRMTENEIMV